MLVSAMLAGGVVELHGMATIGGAKTGIPTTGMARIGTTTITIILSMTTITLTTASQSDSDGGRAINYGYGYGGCSWLRRRRPHYR